VISVDGELHEIILMIIHTTDMNSIKINKNVVCLKFLIELNKSTDLILAVAVKPVSIMTTVPESLFHFGVREHSPW
jgi:hypothetical protein